MDDEHLAALALLGRDLLDHQLSAEEAAALLTRLAFMSAEQLRQARPVVLEEVSQLLLARGAVVH